MTTLSNGLWPDEGGVAVESTVWRRRRNRLKALTSSKKPALAMWVTIPWPSVAEIAGAWGVDAVIIDLEHTMIGLESAERLIVAADAAGVTPVVRPPALDRPTVGRLLDAGAQGMLFPRVEDPASAASARASLRHPPEGTRGWGGAHTRHAMWQGGSAIAGRLPRERGVYSREYVDKAADDIFCAFLIETRAGVEHIEEILDAGQPDAVDFGRGDFSAEVGFDDQACDAAFERVWQACRARGIGMNIPPSEVRRWWYPGCYTVTGLDALLLSDAIRDAAGAARTALATASRANGGEQDGRP